MYERAERTAYRIWTLDTHAAARERARLTQDGLGHAVGVTGRTVSNWERGRPPPH